MYPPMRSAELTGVRRISGREGEVSARKRSSGERLTKDKSECMPTRELMEVVPEEEMSWRDERWQ